jgi:ribosomal protein L11 methyltransferase
MASKLGAREVEAFDIDEWSVINGKENIENNHCNNISIHQGKVTDMNFTSSFDIILANINKNILLQEMQHYVTHLKPNGLLLMSGFYVADIPDLETQASKLGLQKVDTKERETWAAVLFERTG